MQHQEDIAARRLDMVIEQYVESRKRRYGYVATDQASRVIRRILNPDVSDHELDDRVAALAVKNGLAVVFDRGVRQTGAEADLDRKESTMRAPTETQDVVGAADAILAQPEPILSMDAAIALLRQRTGTKRSDADLEGLLTKKAAVLGIDLSRGPRSH
ncbi:MAG: hypothetical protein E5V49_04635 [Mesorhizobium sp.]|nr:hypothetical protein EN848_05165 [bacterium M00.F.Ca.ET.205.01.1.1]TGU54106.1 hypothetical protein EN795_09580 [bacterium M00.F.Ca.ET.152.01.1.1]TGV36985.1 hypothetical protein EN829_009605 [Mesorhizobium sp. M00.F.Ca.ET.186.01.1.1]TGZ41774.1 hypothetical protein EN805_18845 [bacterium M00.F.Ca.ET.162.01.1.1]TIW62743.1 MAG: hypothetical protein E5V48_03320 [Mesorhizobium sp.]